MTLDNLSLLIALQPADITEAVDANQGSPIARAKLRMIFAVARMMFGLNPADVGSPLVPIVAQGNHLVPSVACVCAYDCPQFLILLQITKLRGGQRSSLLRALQGDGG